MSFEEGIEAPDDLETLGGFAQGLTHAPPATPHIIPEVEVSNSELSFGVADGPGYVEEEPTKAEDDDDCVTATNGEGPKDGVGRSDADRVGVHELLGSAPSSLDIESALSSTSREQDR